MVDLQPVIISMCIYLALINIVPFVVTKPTGISVIDDLVLFIISQKPAAMSGIIFVGTIVLLTERLKN